MKRLLPTVSALFVALAGCAPIPISSKIYAPNPADAKVVQGRSGGCSINETPNVAQRSFGTAQIQVHFWPGQPDAAKPQANGSINISQLAKTGPIRSVKINPDRVRLEENGKSYAPVKKQMNSATHQKSGARFDSAYMAFPATTGRADTLRMVFLPGAISIGGKTVDFAPIRFTKTTEVAIYLFPCIPA